MKEPLGKSTQLVYCYSHLAGVIKEGYSNTNNVVGIGTWMAFTWSLWLSRYSSDYLDAL